MVKTAPFFAALMLVACTSALPTVMQNWSTRNLAGELHNTRDITFDRQEFESFERRAPSPTKRKGNAPKPHPKPRHRKPQQLSVPKEISAVAKGMRSVIQEAKATMVPGNGGAPPTPPTDLNAQNTTVPVPV